MIVKGRYEEDDNWYFVYNNNRIYTISKATGNYAYVQVGYKTALGVLLTQEEYDKLENECEEIGIFDMDKGELMI